MTDDALPDAPAELPADLQLTMEQALLPPPGSLELERTPEHDFRQRLRWRPFQVAELFVENSKITAATGHNTVLDGERLAQARHWYLTTAYRPEDGDVDDGDALAAGARVPTEALPEPLQGVLADLVRPGPTADLLYAIDPFVLLAGRSFRLATGTGWLWLDRHFDADEGARLSAAVRGLPDGAMARAQALLALVAVPQRYLLLQGARGYRRTLVDLGRLLERLEASARARGAGLTATLDFHDHEIDRLLLLDGVERSTHALCLIEWAAGAEEQP